MSSDDSLRESLEASGTGIAQVGPGDPSDQAASVFGDRLGLAVRFVRLLAGPGVEHGLIGPRELGQLWDRHLLNCAYVTDLLPEAARVVDVGSGAGLPGLVLAIRRPDLRVDLVEPMERRTSFLIEAVQSLDLGGQVRVIRGRVDEASVIEAAGSSAWVTARAVAPLERLVRWCLPLLVPGGQLLAMKGRRAEEEINAARRSLQLSGGRLTDVVEVGTGTAMTRVVRVTRVAPVRPARRSGR